jgi:hypothetical protein
MDERGRIRGIACNYERMSFNMGPSLLSWMEQADPGTYAAILCADRLSRERFGGHGAAMAQAYGHAILPLLDSRDKRTQVLWGVRDFTHRFGRAPEGMWLPECAVDLETLSLLAEHGVRFTVLAPHQAARVRAVGEQRWRAVEPGGLDTGVPYVQHLPGGRQLAVFFYDGALAHQVAFGDLVKSGDRLAGAMARAARSPDGAPRLAHIATDGETYGHHATFADMALARALEVLEAARDVRLTVYGEALAAMPPAFEVQVAERTSWSCVHGVERWRADCGCTTGGDGGTHQRWRAPLRAALDELRQEVAWTGRPTTSPASSPRTAAAPTGPPRGWRRWSCWRCSGTPWPCTPAADGSSTRSRASSRCRLCATPRA